MKLTKEFLKRHSACRDGYEYWIKTNEPDLIKFIHICKKDNHLDWANWLIVRAMNREQRLKYAIFAAEKVLHIFEAEYPDDKRPRDAIKAAKAVLKNDTQKNRNAAYDACDAAAYAAAYAAYDATYAAAAAADAAAAAYDAACDAAADAAYAAYDAAYAADAACREDMLWTILEFGMKAVEGMEE
jgi:hypothetical protein